MVTESSSPRPRRAGRLVVTRAERLAVAGSIVLMTSMTWACTGQTDISFFVLVKSSNYAQDASGNLTRTGGSFSISQRPA